MKRWAAFLLAGLFIIPQVTIIRAEDLTDGYTGIEVFEDQEAVFDNAIEEIDSVSDTSGLNYDESEDLIMAESSEEYVEELSDEPEEVGATSSTATITGVYNSSKGGDVRWTKVNGATGYVLYRMRSADGLKKVTTINNPNTLQYIDGGIKDNCWGRVYSYYVRPVINGKEGAKSNELTLQRLAPMKFTKNTSTAVGEVSLTYACTVNSNKALGYEIQYATSTGDLYNQKGSFKKVSLNGRNNLNKSINGLSKGQAYYFRVRGYVNYTHSVTGKTTKTWSQYSEVVSVKTQSNIVKVGDTIFFGAYEQDGNSSNGKERIEWLVLDKNDSQAFILSKYALDCKKYNEKQTLVTWEKCTLRSWLNDSFLNTAFNTQEKNKILLTNVINGDNPDYGIDGGNNTKDKIYILSVTEARKYFKDDNDEDGKRLGQSVARACKPTAFTVKQGAWRLEWDSRYFGPEFKKYDGNCSCWLRTPGVVQDMASCILYTGTASSYGADVSTRNYAVRPVMWIDLS